jgi:hypothetical protein
MRSTDHGCILKLSNEALFNFRISRFKEKEEPHFWLVEKRGKIFTFSLCITGNVHNIHANPYSMTAEENFPDPNKNVIDRSALRKARVVALLLAAATIVSLLFLITAFVHKQRADLVEKELRETKQQLESCRAAH